LARPLIFNSTPLIYVVRVSLSSSLMKLDQPKITTTSVYDELLKGEAVGKPEAKALRRLIDERAIRLRDPKNTDFVQRIIKLAAEVERSPLHKAEADIIALSKESHGVAISDDHVARSVAKLVDVELHGTGYLLGRIYKTGGISKHGLLRKVGEMRTSGWRIAEADYERVLDYLRRL